MIKAVGDDLSDDTAWLALADRLDEDGRRDEAALARECKSRVGRGILLNGIRAATPRVVTVQHLAADELATPRVVTVYAEAIPPTPAAEKPAPKRRKK